MSNTIFTIGYEGASLGNFIDTLATAGIERVIDIRDVPASRKPGFSKNALAAALGEAGIDYRHLKPLGDPKPGREAMRRGDKEQFLNIYADHVRKPEAQASLQNAVDLASETASVLLCYERDPKDCHRTLVAGMMKDIGSFAVRHLGVVTLKAVSRGAGNGVGTGAVFATG